MLAFTCVRGVGLCVRPLSTHACDSAKAVVFELLAGRVPVSPLSPYCHPLLAWRGCLRHSHPLLKTWATHLSSPLPYPLFLTLSLPFSLLPYHPPSACKTWHPAQVLRREKDAPRVNESITLSRLLGHLPLPQAIASHTPHTSIHPKPRVLHI